MPPLSSDPRRLRAAFDAQRYEAFEAWRREFAPVQDARETLDPQQFMRRRAEALAGERLRGEAQAARDPMIDPLGSARLVCAAEAAGLDTVSARLNLRNDIRTGLLENTQENGHISVIDVPINEMGEAHVAGMPLYDLFLRGIHPGRVEWANTHGTINIHEEFLSSAHFSRESLRQNYGLMVVSPLPEDVGATDKQLRKEGYRPDSRKMMLRMHRFEQQGQSWRRITEQLCVSGSDIKLINQTLRELGVVKAEAADLTTTEVLDHPFLLRHSAFPEGVAGVAQMLDVLKAEQTGAAYFCGKASAIGNPTRELYSNLGRVSSEREAAFGEFITELEAFAYNVAQDETLTLLEQTKMYEKKKLEVVRRICALHPEYAAHAFGEKAAVYYRAAHDAVEQGNSAAASTALENAFQNSTTLVECGMEISQENQSSQQESAASQSAAERQEALHCLELKVQGYTIRENVNCPACSHITGSKVRAYETVEAIRCMNDDCGYKINKLDGSVIHQSKYNLQTSQEQAVVTSGAVTMGERRLQRGRRYQIGNEQYEYQEQISIGSAEPLFIAVDGSELRGDVARQLHQSLTLSGAQAA